MLPGSVFPRAMIAPVSMNRAASMSTLSRSSPVATPRREVIRSVLRRGVATGELRAGVDIEAALFMLTGAVIARGKTEPGSIPPGYAGRVVDELLLGLSPR